MSRSVRRQDKGANALVSLSPIQDDAEEPEYFFEDLDTKEDAAKATYFPSDAQVVHASSSSCAQAASDGAEPKDGRDSGGSLASRARPRPIITSREIISPLLTSAVEGGKLIERVDSLVLLKTFHGCNTLPDSPQVLTPPSPHAAYNSSVAEISRESYCGVHLCTLAG